MKEHDIKVFMTIDETVVTCPDCESAKIFVGDTLRFSSPQGKVEIEWKKNPFDKPAYKDGDVLYVSSAGPFLGDCFVIRADGTRVGWPGRGLEGKTGSNEPPPPPPDNNG